MNRALAMLGAIGAALALVAGVAYADEISCDGGRCEGTENRDRIFGSFVRDEIYALGGADNVRAYEGRDFVDGGGQPDDIRLGDGHDRGHGGPVGDDIYGGPGNDRLRGGKGTDGLIGESGDDVLRAGVGGEPQPGPGGIVSEYLEDRATNDQDTVYGGPGAEFALVEDGDGRDFVNCGRGRYDLVEADPGDVVKNCEEEN